MDEQDRFDITRSPSGTCVTKFFAPDGKLYLGVCDEAPESRFFGMDISRIRAEISYLRNQTSEEAKTLLEKLETAEKSMFENRKKGLEKIEFMKKRKEELGQNQ